MHTHDFAKKLIFMTIPLVIVLMFAVTGTGLAAAGDYDYDRYSDCEECEEIYIYTEVVTVTTQEVVDCIFLSPPGTYFGCQLTTTGVQVTDASITSTTPLTTTTFSETTTTNPTLIFTDGISIGTGETYTVLVESIPTAPEILTGTITITETSLILESVEKVCDLCVHGAAKVTIKLDHRDQHGDRYERIRVRTLDGMILFDTYDDGNPYGHGGLYVGESFMVHIPNPGDEIVITVQGDNHRHETVKAQFDTDCGLTVGDQDGNSYIKFEVIDIVTDNADQQLCEEHDPPAEPCELCIEGASQVTIELIHRASHGDRYERIRVRQSDGTVLFDTYYDGDPYGHYGLFVDESFTIDVPDPGEELMITVQGENHHYETVKAWFNTDCGLAVGDQDGNSYIKFEVINIVTDSTDQCEDEDIVTDSVRVARSAAGVSGELDVSLFMPDPEMPTDEAIDENGEIVSFSADYSGDMIFIDARDMLSDYNGDVIIIDTADTTAPEIPTAVTVVSQTAWVSSMSVILFALSLCVCTTAVTRRF